MEVGVGGVQKENAIDRRPAAARRLSGEELSKVVLLSHDHERVALVDDAVRLGELRRHGTTPE